MKVQREQRIGIAGLGAIGQEVAFALDSGLPGMKLTVASSRDKQKAKSFLAKLKTKVDVVEVGELSKSCDILIECAPAEMLASIIGPVIDAGGRVIVLSVGALLDHPELVERARVTGAQILVPTGALIGLDAVSAAAEGEIYSVKMVTRKPPRGLVGAPFLLERGIDVSELTKPLKLYEGNARGAAKGFPANLNVAVALGLAGIGPDLTSLEVWADPGVTRNTHTITVDSDSASFTMTIENIPSENPKTGRITAKSVISLLRKISAPLRVGT